MRVGARIISLGSSCSMSRHYDRRLAPGNTHQISSALTHFTDRIGDRTVHVSLARARGVLFADLL